MNKLIALLLILSLRSLGQGVQWFDTIHFSSNNRISGMVTDGVGNICLAGYFSPAYHDYTNPYGVFVLKYDSLGNVLWLDSAQMRVDVNGLAIDSNNDLYIVAYSQYGGIIKFGSYTFSTPAGAGKFYLVKYSGSGTILWAREYSDAKPKGIVIDSNDNIYCFGDIQASTTFDSFPLSIGNFIGKFDSNGNCSLAFSSASEIGNIAIDKGSIYVTDRNGSSAPNLLKKYSSVGSFQWSQNIGPGGVIHTYGNALYLTGGFYNSSVNLGTFTLMNPFTTGPGIPMQWYFAKLDTNGNYLWATTPNDSVSIHGFAVKNNVIYLTGYSGWGGGDAVDRRLYVMQYDTSGSFLNENKFYSEYTGTQIVCQGNSIYVSGSQSYLNYLDAFLVRLSNNYVTSVSNQEKSEEGALIFPNPTKNSVTIFLNKEIKDLIIKIISSKGDIVFVSNTESPDKFVSLDLSHFSKGIYFIEIVADRRRTTHKVIVE